MRPLIAALLIAYLLAGGCSSPAPGDCAADCHADHDPGTRALLDCVAGCTNDNAPAQPTSNGDH